MGAKRKREGADEEAEAAAAVRQFLADFAALPLDALGAEAARQQTQALFDGMQQRGAELPALKRLLAAA